MPRATWAHFPLGRALFRPGPSRGQHPDIGTRGLLDRPEVSGGAGKVQPIDGGRAGRLLLLAGGRCAGPTAVGGVNPHHWASPSWRLLSDSYQELAKLAAQG
jgi:hypothetical protein